VTVGWAVPGGRPPSGAGLVPPVRGRIAAATRNSRNDPIGGEHGGILVRRCPADRRRGVSDDRRQRGPAPGTQKEVPATMAFNVEPVHTGRRQPRRSDAKPRRPDVPVRPPAFRASVNSPARTPYNVGTVHAGRLQPRRNCAKPRRPNTARAGTAMRAPV